MFEVMPEGERGKAKEKESKISRRDFLRVATGLTLTGTGAIAGGYFAKRGFEELGLRFEERDAAQLSSKDFFDEEARILSQQTKEAPTQTPEPTAEATTPPEETPEPTPTPEVPKYFQFGQIDFEKDEQIGASYFLNDEQILIPYFKPRIWYEGYLDTGEFDPSRKDYEDIGLVYGDNGDRKILNLHSGRRGPLDEQGFSAYKLQIFLEENPVLGVRRYSTQVNKIVRNIIGSEVVFKQGSNFAYSNIIAAVRVPPNLVNESKLHVYNINEWLAETFPDSGFSEVLNYKHDVMTVKFCGRQFADENKRGIYAKGEPPYRQARFFIASKLS